MRDPAAGRDDHKIDSLHFRVSDLRILGPWVGAAFRMNHRRLSAQGTSQCTFPRGRLYRSAILSSLPDTEGRQIPEADYSSDAGLPGYLPGSTESIELVTDRPRLRERLHNERPHVLIVSDDESLSTFLNEGLPLGGFWTTVIASGLQALEVFRLRQFDLVIIDWSLQSFGALELLKRLRGLSTRTSSREVRTTAPVILISEQPVHVPIEDQALLRISRLLHAPLEIDDVVRELHGVFEEWRTAYPDALLSDDPSRDRR